ncbi:hypothetical protein [Rubripirellula tenax]|nr:hypothetical protein [Rubripirellula tenax]
MRNGPNSLQLLSHLEALLTQTAEPTRAEVEAAHTQASSAIRRVNERLTQAHQLIAGGRRAEAIEIAEGPPHVLDEIASLDSAIIRDWEHYTGQFGLPRFVPLRTDLASLLNGAYTAENQLEHLLRRHRTLSIGRANLRQRIATLSQLAAADPSSLQWTKSLGECQAIRIEQLVARASVATRAADLRCLNQLMSELQGTRWVMPVPKSLVDTVTGAIGKLQNRDSTTEAVVIAEHLQDAYASGDATRIGPLVRRFREIEKHVDAASVGDAMGPMMSVVQWHENDLAQQKVAAAQEQALSKVNHLSDQSEAGEIREVMEKIAATGADVPEDVRSVYVEKVKSDAKAKRTRAMLISGAAAAAMLVTVTVAAMIYRSLRAEAAVKLQVDAAEDALKKGDLKDLAQILRNAPVSDDRFAPLRQRLDELELVERTRAAAFTSDVESLRAQFATSDDVSEFDRLRTQVGDVADRAKTADEESVAAKLVEDLATSRTNRLDAVIAAARTMNARILGELKSFAPDSNANRKLRDWNIELQTALSDRWVRSESQLVSELSITSNQVADQRDLVAQRSTVEKSIERITDSVGDWKAWAALGNAADRMDPAVTGKFLSLARVVDEERSLWEGLDQWNRIASQWKLGQLLDANVESAAEVKKAAYAIKNAGLSDLPAAQKFLAAAEVATPMVARNRRTLDILLAQLKSAKMNNIGAIRLKAQSDQYAVWYYFKVAANGTAADSVSESSTGLLRIDALTDLALTRERADSVSASKIALPSDFASNREAYLTGEKPMWAPHVPIAHAITGQLETLPDNPDRWDSVFGNAYRDVMAATSVDPIVRYYLATGLLQIGAKGSWRLATIFADHLQIIEQEAISREVNWIAPADSEATTTRDFAATSLEKLAQLPLTNPSSTVSAMQSSLDFSINYVPYGWIDQASGRWIVRSPDRITSSGRSGKLLVRMPRATSARTEDASESEMVTIGSVREGTVILNDSIPDAAFRVGRPAWLAVESGVETR